MTANETVAAVVERERKARGLTRLQLGVLLGQNSAWVSRKLNGDRAWTLEDLDLLSERLGIPLAALLMAPREAVAVTLRYLRRVLITIPNPTRVWHFSPISA